MMALVAAAGRRGRRARQRAVRPLNRGESRRLTDLRGRVGGRREERKIRGDVGGLRHQERQFARRQPTGNQLHPVRYLYPRAAVVILIPILEIALETDLYFRVETFRHVGHVVVVERRHLLEIAHAVVQVRYQSLLDDRIDVLELADVPRYFSSTFGKSRTEFS